jgi:outer membrane protein assembly factor BamE
MRKLYPWLGLLALAGCKQASEFPSVISPYKIDIQQGNVVTQEMLAKLKAGMTRAQVRFALGSPLVIDPFRTDRWDYVYSYQKQGKGTDHRRVTVIFDEDKLLRIEGDVLPVDPSLISDRPLQPRPPAATAPAAADKPAAPIPEAAKPAAPKPEPAQPAEKPVVKAPAAKPAVAKPAEQPAAAKPAAPPAAPAQADAKAGKTTVDGAPSKAAKADTQSAPAEAKPVDTKKADADKEKPKPTGFFGRMMDKIGF